MLCEKSERFLELQLLYIKYGNKKDIIRHTLSCGTYVYGLIEKYNSFFNHLNY